MNECDDELISSIMSDVMRFLQGQSFFEKLDDVHNFGHFVQKEQVETRTLLERFHDWKRDLWVGMRNFFRHGRGVSTIPPRPLGELTAGGVGDRPIPIGCHGQLPQPVPRKLALALVGRSARWLVDWRQPVAQISRWLRDSFGCRSKDHILCE